MRRSVIFIVSFMVLLFVSQIALAGIICECGGTIFTSTRHVVDLDTGVVLHETVYDCNTCTYRDVFYEVCQCPEYN